MRGILGFIWSWLLGVTTGKQTVFVSVDRGLGEQVNSDLLPAGQLLTAKNAYYPSQGGLRQRPGFRALSTAFGTAGTLVTSLGLTPMGVTAFGGSLVALNGCGEYPMLSYAPEAGRWMPPADSGVRLHGVAKRVPINTGDVQVGKPVIASDGDGGRCVAWEDRGAAAVTVVVEEAGSVLQTYTTAGATRPRVVYAGGYYWLTYVSAGAIEIMRLSGSSAPSTATAIASVAANATHDILVRGGLLYIAANAVAATSIRLQAWSVSGNSASGATATIGSVDGDLALTWLEDPLATGDPWLASIGTTNGVVVNYMNLAGSTLGSAYVVDAAANDARNVTGYAYPGTEFRIAYETDASPWTNIMRGQRVAGVVSSSVWIRDASIMTRTGYYNGRHFLFLANNWYAGAYHLVEMQPSGAASSAAQLTLAPQSHFDFEFAQSGDLGNIVGAGANQLTALARRARLLTDTFEGSTVSPEVYEISFDSRLPQPTNYGPALAVPGGAFRTWDGVTFAEGSFATAPVIENTVTGGIGSIDVAGAFDYFAVYRFSDGKGNVWRSSPSLNARETLSSGGNVVAHVKPLTIGSRNLTTVHIELYREDISGIARLVATEPNDPTVSYVEITDNLTSTQIAAREPLYCDARSGILQNDQPPGFVAIALHNGRVIGVDQEIRTRLWASKPVIPGAGLAFSEVLTYEIPEAGEITNVLSLDDKLVVLATKGVFVVIGDFADNLGNGASLQHHWIARHVVTNARSAVVFDGVWFESGGKLWKLGRGLDIAPMEQANDTVGTIQDAFLVPERHQLWFCGASNIGVFDTIRGLWSTYGVTQLGGCNFDGDAVALRSGYGHWIQDDAQTKDPSGNIIMEIRPPWLAFGGMGQEFRLHEFHVRGRAVDTTNMSLEIEQFYDYSATSTAPNVEISSVFDPVRIKVRPDKRKAEAWSPVVRTKYGVGVDSVAGVEIYGFVAVVSSRQRIRAVGDSQTASDPSGIGG